jgi:hypothetical protein
MKQKPKETEVDLIKHLLCRMRDDILTMIGVSQDASLDEIIMKAQIAEEILYRRNKEQRRTLYYKQVLLQGDELYDNKFHNNEINKRCKSFQKRKINNLK